MLRIANNRKMAASREIALRNLRNARKPKGSKSWKTIAKEKAREEYENKLAREFDEITTVQFENAKKPKEWKERTYVVDQLIGKPKDRFEGEIKGEVDMTLKKAIEKIYGKKDKELD